MKGLLFVNRCLLLLLFLLPTISIHGLVLPTGLFCPYRSDALQQHTDLMTTLNLAHQKLLTTFVSRNPLEDIEDFLYEFERLIHHQETSSDYQLNEFCHFFESHVANHQLRQIRDTLIPFCRQLSQELVLDNSCGDADGGQEDEKKKSIDENLLELQRLAADTSTGSGSTAEDIICSITVDPFLTPAFQSLPKKVQLEIQELQDDHQKLIREKGANFYCNQNKFHQQEEQEQYLNQMRCVEERYMIAFTRFQMITNDNDDYHHDIQNGSHSINPQYIRQCEQILKTLKLNEETYQKLHAKSLGYKTKFDTTTLIQPLTLNPLSSSSSPVIPMIDEYDYTNAFQ